MFLGLLLALAACGGAPQATSPQNSGAATSQSAAASPAGSASAPASAIASSNPNSFSAGSATASTAAASSKTPAADGTQAAALKLTLPDNSSQMNITMHELLAGNAAQTKAMESAKAVNGTILLDTQGNVLPGSRIDMDLRTLQSDRQIRDNFIKRVTLQTNQFPMVDFVPKQVQGLEGGIPASGQRNFKLVGDATIKGVTRPMTWDVTATFGPQGCQGEATSSFKLTDFGLTPPKAGPVISVEDSGSIMLSFQATNAAA